MKSLKHQTIAQYSERRSTCTNLSCQTDSQVVNRHAKSRTNTDKADDICCIVMSEIKVFSISFTFCIAAFIKRLVDFS